MGEAVALLGSTLGTNILFFFVVNYLIVYSTRWSKSANDLEHVSDVHKRLKIKTRNFKQTIRKVRKKSKKKIVIFMQSGQTL